MWRIALTVSALLLTLHGLLTFVFAFAIFRGSTSEHLAFAAHGCTFLLVALLNLVTWRQPGTARVLSGLVHAANLAFLAFCVAFAFARPEPPLYVAAALMLAITASAIGTDVMLHRGAPATSWRPTVASHDP